MSIDSENPGFNPDGVENPEDKTEERERVFEYGHDSIASEKHPERNEDAFFVNEEEGVIGVFDGAGGHAMGDEASRIASEVVQRALKGKVFEEGNYEKIKTELHNALIDAHNAVLEIEVKVGDSKKNQRPATTGIIVKLIDNGKNGKLAMIANVGDSRVYRKRAGETEVELITIDQGVLRSLNQREKITRVMFQELQVELDSVQDVNDLKSRPFLARLWKFRAIIDEAIGEPHRMPQPSFEMVNLVDGDELFIVSDGVSDNLSTKELNKIGERNMSTYERARQLTSSSLERSRDKAHIRHKPDDITAVVVKV